MTTVLVASGGGHLQQLFGLVPRLGLQDDVVWVTPHSGLSEGLLRNERHVEIPYAPPRDWKAALRLTGTALHMLADLGATRVVSTGSSPAPPFFLAGARLGLELHYIESATRSKGPSMSGKLVARLPSAELYTQYPGWANERWHYAGSIFDGYSVVDAGPASTPIRRVVVTLGTEAFDFRRAVERILQVLPSDAEVLWQTGYTDVGGLGIEAHASVPSNELRAAIDSADLVISHAGTGSALTAFDLGKAPLLLPRSAKHGEHIDDHQSLTCEALTRRGLAVATPVEELSAAHLENVRRIRVIQDPVVRPFHLTTAAHTAGILSMGARRRSEKITVPAPRGPIVDLRDSAEIVIDLRTPSRRESKSDVSTTIES